MVQKQVSPKFKLGRMVMTSGVADKVTESAAFSQFVSACIKRHWFGDWGDLDAHDKNENEVAAQKGNLRILSSYEEDGLPKIWIITEADRLSTTILFPDEY